MTQQETVDRLIILGIEKIKAEQFELQEANLQKADLWGADLWGADLRGANLQKADLWGANLRGANLQKADLQKADLWGANLRGANLQKADLRGADLRGADLRGAKDVYMSHEITVEILRQNAGDDIGKLALAGLILITRWCWHRWHEPFIGFEDLRPWVKETLLSDPSWGYAEMIKW